VPADIELAGIVADDHCVAKQAMRLPGQPFTEHWQEISNKRS